MVSAKGQIGFHYYPDDRHFTQKDLDYWQPILTSLSASWLTLKATAARAIPEFFIQGLSEIGVKPIIHLPAQVGSLPATELTTLMASYAHWGVEHVVVYDRPNMRSAWNPSEWSKVGLVERFLDQVLPILQAQRGAGLKPVLPPLEPGGDYWDTAFLSACLKGLLRRGQKDLVRSLALAGYLWTNEKPLSWGAGGPRQWPEAKPYHTPEGSQDQRGFHLFDWYGQISTDVTGQRLPLLVIGGGDLPHGNDPIKAQDTHAEVNLAIARQIVAGEHTSDFENFAFFLLAAEAEDPLQKHAWFPALRPPLPVVDAFKRLIASGPKQVPPQPEKAIPHYLLLPNDQRAARETWLQASDYALAHPELVVGFSPEVAAKAARVTLAGGEDRFSLVLENQLRTAGCVVQRMSFVQQLGASKSPLKEAVNAAAGAGEVNG